MCSCHYPRMLCHVFLSQVEYKFVCFVFMQLIKNHIQNVICPVVIVIIGSEKSTF